MAKLNYTPDGIPDPSIEEIESAILKSRIEGVDSKTEIFLAKRARERMRQRDIAQSKDDRVKRAFLEGYRQGHDGGTFFTKVLAVAMIVLVLLMGLF